MPSSTSAQHEREADQPGEPMHELTVVSSARRVLDEAKALIRRYGKTTALRGAVRRIVEKRLVHCARYD